MWIVEPFDVVKDSGSGFRPGPVFLSVQLLCFHTAIKTFHDGVVVALTTPAQNALDAQVWLPWSE